MNHWGRSNRIGEESKGHIREWTNLRGFCSNTSFSKKISRGTNLCNFTCSLKMKIYSAQIKMHTIMTSSSTWTKWARIGYLSMSSHKRSKRRKRVFTGLHCKFTEAKAQYWEHMKSKLLATTEADNWDMQPQLNRLPHLRRALRGRTIHSLSFRLLTLAPIRKWSTTLPAR